MDPITHDAVKVLDSAAKLANDANELLREVKELSHRALSERSSPARGSPKFVIMRKAPSSWRRDGSEDPVRNNGSQNRF